MDPSDAPSARAGHGVDLGAFAAVAAAAAGVLHLAMAPGRAGDATAIGVAFVVLALVQFACAAHARRGASLVRWQAVAFAEAVVVGGWVASWTVGLPVGARSGAEPVRIADLVTCAFEMLVLAAAVLVVAAPRAVRRAREGDVRPATRATAALVGLAVVAALFSDGALDGRDRAGAVAAVTTTPTATAAPRVAGLDDMPGATMLLPGETAPPSTAGSPATTAAPATTLAGDRGFAALAGGRRVVADVAVDAPTRAALAAQLAGTAALVTAYPTIAAAEAAGYRRAGPFSPGIGTPYAPPVAPGNLDGRIDDADVRDAVLLFDGTAPGSRLAGFEYLSVRTRTDGEPEGFAGPNDHWTYATDVCRVTDARGVVGSPFGIDRAVSRAQCDAAGGALVPFAWFVVRVWTVPGYAVADGIFRDLNPAITCPDGSYFVKPIEQVGTTGTLCR